MCVRERWSVCVCEAEGMLCGSVVCVSLCEVRSAYV